MIEKVWLVWCGTLTAPLGEMAPFAPAVAVIVCTSSSATAKSPNPVSPVACVLVAVRAPTVGTVQAELAKRPTTKLSGAAAPSRSPASKLNVAL